MQVLFFHFLPKSNGKMLVMLFLPWLFLLIYRGERFSLARVPSRCRLSLHFDDHDRFFIGFILRFLNGNFK